MPPLHLAASKGDLKTVKRILERKEFQIESLDDSQKTPLHHAALNGHKDIVNLLLENYAEIDSLDEWNDTPLLHAVEKGHIDIVKLLLENQSNINAINAWKKWTPLHYASENGHTDIVKILIDKTTDFQPLDKWKRTPIDLAINGGYFEIVKLLHYKNNNKTVENHQIDMHKVLLEHETAVYPLDEKYWTPLHWAAQFGHLETVKLLLQNAILQGISSQTV